MILWLRKLHPSYWRIRKSAYRYIALLLFSAMCALSSCKHSDNFNNREYTSGVYKDFNLHREKSGKEKTADSTAIENGKGARILEKLDVPELPSLREINMGNSPEAMTEAFQGEYPVIAAKIDDVIAKQVTKDSSWINDSLPECIETAFSAQAMLGVGTVGGLVTIAAPEFIWVSIIAMIGVPFFLLISLIAAGIAMGKINRGELDSRYRKWMQLWAVCLLINILLGSIVLLHFTAL